MAELVTLMDCDSDQQVHCAVLCPAMPECSNNAPTSFLLLEPSGFLPTFWLEVEW